MWSHRLGPIPLGAEPDWDGKPFGGSGAMSLDARVRTVDRLVIVFGGRARGEAGPDRDLDLMVVVDDPVPAEQRRVRAAFQALAATADAVPGCTGP
jgi:hypothetical protein